MVTADPVFAVLGLRLPFGRARVIWLGDPELGDALDELAPGRFDTVVLDADSLGRDRRGEALRRAVEGVRTGGRVLVAVDVTRAVPAWPGAVASSPSAPDVTSAVPEGTAREPGWTVPSGWTPTGLTWRGVGTLEGRVCAVLRREEVTDTAAGTDTAAADVTGRLAALEQAVDAVGRLIAERQRVEWRAHLRERHDSEAALVAHLRSVADALEAERQRREAAERRYETLMKRYKQLEARHNRLLGSKLGTLTVHYWQLRKKLRRLVGPSAEA